MSSSRATHPLRSGYFPTATQQANREYLWTALDGGGGGAVALAPDLVVFTVIVDDLVFPDGTTKMGVMGGGGPQTAFGLRCHPADLSVGLAAGVGADLPAACSQWLLDNEVDTSGLALVRDRDTAGGSGGGGGGGGGGGEWEVGTDG